MSEGAPGEGIRSLAICQYRMNCDSFAATFSDALTSASHWTYPSRPGNMPERGRSHRLPPDAAARSWPARCAVANIARATEGGRRSLTDTHCGRDHEIKLAAGVLRGNLSRILVRVRSSPVGTNARIRRVVDQWVMQSVDNGSYVAVARNLEQLLPGWTGR